MSRWNVWVDIEKNASYKSYGVYKIRLADLKNCSIEIPRFLDKDKDGIIQIGRSKDIEKRMKRFRGAMEGKKYAHAEGKRLFLMKKHTNFIGRYNNFKIQYSFKKFKNECEINKEEERLLKCYFKKYGEVPPLNHNLPKKDINWESLDCD